MMYTQEDNSDLGQTGAEGEFVWKKTGSSLEEDEVEASVDTRHEEDFLSLTTTSVQPSVEDLVPILYTGVP